MTPAILKWQEINKLKFADHNEEQHLIDYLSKEWSHKKSINFNYEECVKKAKRWVEALHKKALKLKSQGEVKVIKDYGDLKMVRLIDQASRSYEGNKMGHCVGSYSNKHELYSLRDQENRPHCTIEISNGFINQIKGKSNGPVSPYYVKEVLEFLKSKKLSINSDEIENLGYTSDKDFIHFVKENFEDPKLITIKKQTFLFGYHQMKLKQSFHQNIKTEDDIQEELVKYGQVEAIKAFMEADWVKWRNHYNRYNALFLNLFSRLPKQINIIKPIFEFFPLEHQKKLLNNKQFRRSILDNEASIASFLMEKGYKPNSTDLAEMITKYQYKAIMIFLPHMVKDPIHQGMPTGVFEHALKEAMSYRESVDIEYLKKLIKLQAKFTFSQKESVMVEWLRKNKSKKDFHALATSNDLLDFTLSHCDEKEKTKLLNRALNPDNYLGLSPSMILILTKHSKDQVFLRKYLASKLKNKEFLYTHHDENLDDFFKLIDTYRFSKTDKKSFLKFVQDNDCSEELVNKIATIEVREKL